MLSISSSTSKSSPSTSPVDNCLSKVSCVIVPAENKVSKPFLKVLFYTYNIEMDEYEPADDEVIAHHGYVFNIKQAHQTAKSLIDETVGED